MFNNFFQRPQFFRFTDYDTGAPVLLSRNSCKEIESIFVNGFGSTTIKIKDHVYCVKEPPEDVLKLING